MKIAVGSTSKQKLKYLKKVLADIGIKTKLISVEVSGGIAEQPKTQKETKTGSQGRAEAALKKVPLADFAIGIEVGYHQNKKGKYEMFCCTTIVDSNNFVESCYSSKFLLPAFHQKVLKENKYLGEYVRKYKKEVNKPSTNYVRQLITDREPLITEAIRNTLLRYLDKENFS